MNHGGTETQRSMQKKSIEAWNRFVHRDRIRVSSVAQNNELKPRMKHGLNTDKTSQLTCELCLTASASLLSSLCLCFSVVHSFLLVIHESLHATFL